MLLGTVLLDGVLPELPMLLELQSTMPLMTLMIDEVLPVLEPLASSRCA